MDFYECTVGNKSNSLILNPVENLPFYFTKNRYNEYEGLYITDKDRDDVARKRSKILFGGRQKMIDAVLRTYDLWLDALHAKCITMRPQSGLNAHLLMFLGLGKIGDRVMLLPEEGGGHFSTEGILKRVGYRIFHLPLDRKNYRIDIDRAISLQREKKCSILFVDRSEGLIYEDLSALCKAFEGYKIFDASQYLTNILLGQFTSPFDMGFNMIISTLHKNFPGPQKALVCTNSDDHHWDGIMQVMYECVSNIHADKILMSGDVLKSPKLGSYSKMILENAILLEDALAIRGVSVVRRTLGGPNTHHLWIRFDDQDAAFNAYKNLETSHICTNYRLLPYGLGYGLRLGTSGATVQGLDESYVDELAKIITNTIYGKDTSTQARDLIDNMRKTSIFDY